MTPARLARIFRYKLRRSLLLQLLLITCFWLIGDWLSRTLHLPVPGSVLGLFVLLALFATGWFSTRNLRRGAELFLAELLLFFLPATPAILNHPEFLGWTGIKVLIVILVGTVIVMIVTALVVDACFHWISKRQLIKPHNPEEARP